MKRMIAVVVAGLFLLGAAVSADARGRGGGHGGHGGHGGGGSHGGRFHGHHFHGHGFRGSVVIGTGVWLGPYWGPYGYPPYYPYYPYEPVPVVAEPQTYIQQPAPSYWYYCEEAKAYYPYVQQCAGGWLTVMPPAAPESQR